jgi:S-adenosylmethionine synthetase
MSKTFFTSESVTEGHPDKLCDQIADALLDAYLEGDSRSRCAIEVCATTGMVFIFGEVTSKTVVDIEEVAREVIREIGYTDSSIGFDYKTCGIVTSLKKQSSDISRGVDEASDYAGDSELDKLGAGDQGMMFGYACDETKELMPLSITLAHALSRRLSEVRKSGEIPWLRPDGKAQVTVEYDDGVPTRVDTIVLSTQHDPDVAYEDIKKTVIEKVITPVAQKYIDEKTKFYINPTGRFVMGGPQGDSGLTGRKIIVDTYGGICPHGGGSLSGKDATKVDRSALYMTRYVAKNIVASGLAKKCQIQVSYAIGRSKPVSLAVDTFGTGKVSEEVLIKIINGVFDLRPLAIIRTLRLDRPIFKATTNYGHLGNPDFLWEKTDKADKIQKFIEKMVL